MYVLGIETSCDETAASVVKDGEEILSNVISSQVSLHQKYGGVFPELASRSHLDRILLVIDEALAQAKIKKEEIDLIAVAHGPGLIGALLIGVNIAKTLSLAWDIPFVGINHIEAHLYAAMMNREKAFPSLGVVISGGHTMLLKINNIGEYEKLATTQDDAIGEAFDKTAAILGLSYPGGPQIESLAKKGDPLHYSFKAGQIKDKPLDFSFSGLKTKILYTVKGQKANKNDPILIKEEEKAHIAASFQYAAFSDLIEKSIKAAKTFACKGIYFGGGVSNSQTLRAMFAQKEKVLPLYWPTLGLSLDNAAMIAGLGYHQFLKQNKSDPLDLEAKARIAFGNMDLFEKS